MYRGRGSTTSGGAGFRGRRFGAGYPTPIAGEPAEEQFNEHLNSKGKTQTVLRDDGTEVPATLNNKVFIDGLPYEEPIPPALPLLQQLSNFVSEWKVGKVVALSKKNGQGFGYLAFRSPHSVDVATKVLNGRKFLGRVLRVELPKPRVEQQHASESTAADTLCTRQVLLSDLSKITEAEIIREVLRDYAPDMEKKVQHIKLVSSGRKAFVTLETEQDVAPFVTFMHGFRLLGRSISAEPARAPGTLPFSKKMAPRAFTSPITTEEHVAPKPRSESLSDAVAAAVGALPIKTTNNYEVVGSKSILVGNIPESCTEADVVTHFGTVGRVSAVQMVINPHVKQFSGFAKITFQLPYMADKAVEKLNGSLMHGRTIHVDRDDNPENKFTAAGDHLQLSMPEKGDPAAVGDNDEDSALEFFAQKYATKKTQLKRFMNQRDSSLASSKREREIASSSTKEESRKKKSKTLV